MMKIIRKFQWQDWVNYHQRKDSLSRYFNLFDSRRIHHENQQTFQQIKANYNTQMPLANTTVSALPTVDQNSGAINRDPVK